MIRVIRYYKSDFGVTIQIDEHSLPEGYDPKLSRFVIYCGQHELSTPLDRQKAAKDTMIETSSSIEIDNSISTTLPRVLP
jgi:hypothetical protein